MKHCWGYRRIPYGGFITTPKSIAVSVKCSKSFSSLKSYLLPEGLFERKLSEFRGSNAQPESPSAVRDGSVHKEKTPINWLTIE